MCWRIAHQLSLIGQLSSLIDDNSLLFINTPCLFNRTSSLIVNAPFPLNNTSQLISNNLLLFTKIPSLMNKNLLLIANNPLLVNKNLLLIDKTSLSANRTPCLLTKKNYYIDGKCSRTAIGPWLSNRRGLSAGNAFFRTKGIATCQVFFPLLRARGSTPLPAPDPHSSPAAG